MLVREEDLLRHTLPVSYAQPSNLSPGVEKALIVAICQSFSCPVLRFKLECEEHEAWRLPSSRTCLHDRNCHPEGDTGDTVDSIPGLTTRILILDTKDLPSTLTHACVVGKTNRGPM